MKTLITAKELLHQTGRTLYVDDDVLEAAPRSDIRPVEFFKLGKYVSDDALDEEYESRGLIPATIDDITAVSAETLDEKKYVATHWKDAKDNWCYAVFYRWIGERHVVVNRLDGEWDDHWFFAGVRKSSALGNQPSSDTLSLERAIQMVKDAGYKVIKEL